MKIDVLNLQSVCSLFRLDHHPIGQELNEFWLMIIQRQFPYTKELIAKEGDNFRWKAQRCYGLLSKITKLKFNNACYPITRNVTQNPYYYSLKICMIGQDNVGKTSLVRKSITNSQSLLDEFDMENVEGNPYKKMFTFYNQKFHFEFIDLFCYEEFSLLRDSVTNNAQVIVIAFPAIHDSDSSLEESFTSLITNIRRVLRIKDLDGAACIIACTKCDLLSETNSTPFDTKKKEQFIRRLIASENALNCGIIYTSAKTGEGIEEFKQEIVNRYLTLFSSRGKNFNKEYQNWNMDTIFQKIVTSENEILSIISEGTKSTMSYNCEIL